MAPRIDGNPEDWNIVPDDYAIGMDQFADTEQGHGANIDRKNLDVRIKVGWVKGQHRLYFQYEAHGTTRLTASPPMASTAQRRVSRA